MATTSGRAGLALLYTVDANTLHLWHFGGASGRNCYDETTDLQTPAITLSLTPGNAYPPCGIPTEFVQIGQSPAFPVLSSSVVTIQYSSFFRRSRLKRPAARSPISLSLRPLAIMS